MKLRIDIPRLFAMLGVRKWLAERVFHLPEVHIAGWCAILAAATGTDITPERWRQIEARLVDLLYDGVWVRTGE